MASSSLTSFPAAETQIPQRGSGINVANFVSSKLRRDRRWNNYKSWKEQMLCLVESQGLLEFIGSEAPPPLPKDGVDYVAWRRTDRLVKGWILGALSNEALQKVVHLDSARDVWLDLEKAFPTDQSQQGNFYYPPPPRPSSNDTAPPPSTYPGATPTPPPEYNYAPPPPPSSYPGAPPPLTGKQVIPPLNYPPPPPWNYPPPQGQGGSPPLQLPPLPLLPPPPPPPPPLTQQQGKDWNEYLPLYKAAMSGDWDKARVILEQDPTAIRAKVSFTLETTLHVAVGSCRSTSFVEKLVETSNDDALATRDAIGFNPLHAAAVTGNLEAAKILVRRLPDLLYVSNNRDYFPVHMAAQSGHRETLELLISETRDDLPINPFGGVRGLLLLILLIAAGFLDMALDLVNKYPNLTWINSPSFFTALKAIALKDTSFLIEAQLNFWERFVCSCIQLEMESFDTLDNSPRWRKMVRELHSTLSKVISQLVPGIKKIYEKKLMREQARRLVKCICKHMESLNHVEASSIYRDAMRTAAQLGNHEVVEEIVATFPPAIHSQDDDTHENFLHLAVRNRCEKVFNLMYQTTNHRCHYCSRIDSSGNSILHFAAFLAPPHKLNSVSGAALQMQREIQWFKEVHKFVTPFIKGRINKAGKTPEMIFTEEHIKLKEDGEKWMKDTANSCTIAAALIVTVVFAAAITVPGGNESETGYPMMWENSAFTIFAVSDAVSLFTSATSLLMFLSILTSRYAEQDFLYALPKRLCIGLVTLFLSILFMMAAFSSTLYLVFGRKKAWVLIPVAALTCLPISSFVLLQFPLLIAVISSTYCKGIFGKQSNRPFH